MKEKVDWEGSSREMASVHLAILQLTLLWVVEASIVNTNALPLAKDDCEDHCGNVSKIGRAHV